LGSVPAAPSQLTATPTSGTSIALVWVDNASDETGFKIERSANGVDWSQIDTVGEGIEGYTDTGRTAGTQYYYRVRAYNDSGNSSYSNVATAVPSTLLDNIVAYWKLDEASGTREDSVGSNDLTDNNTVTQAQGKVDEAAQFTNEYPNPYEYLSHADNADLSTGDIDFTIAAWVYGDRTPESNEYWGIVTKDSDSDSREYFLIWNGNENRFHFRVMDGSASKGEVKATTFGAPSTLTWYFIVVWHDATANTVNIQVNNGTVDSAATSGAPADTDAEFRIGRDYSDNYRCWDGRIDEVGFWKRTLTEAERTALYNSGNGVSHPHFCDPVLPTMAEDEFMIAVIPDTQWYTKDGSSEFEDECQWIADHKDDANKNIQMVLHGGDVIWTSEGNVATQLSRADAAMDILDGEDLPYLIPYGNHDYDDDPPIDDRDHVNFDGTFPQSRFTGQAGWSGGFYQGSSYDGNAYCLKTIGGNNYLFMSLSFGPEQAVLTWAAGILDTYSSYDAWIVTHSFLYRDGTRVGDGDEYNPHDIFDEGADTHDGEEMWDELIKLKDNVVFVQSGHDGVAAADGWVQAYRQDDGDEGNLVTQVVCNYHTTTHGGRGFMRLYAVRPSKNRVDAYTYSPSLEQWFRDDDNEFIVRYK